MSQIPRDTSQGMGSVSNVPISGSTAQRDHNPSKVHAFKDEVVGGIKKTIGKVVRSDKMVQEGKAQAAAGKMEARAAEDVAMAKKMGDYSETPSHAFNVPTSQGGEMELTSAGTKTQAGLTSEAQKVTRPVI